MTETRDNTLTVEKTEHVLGKPHKVILFNDDHHDMIEVTLQIVKAIHCSFAHAQTIMFRAHNDGRAVVVVAHKERCELVSDILEEIRLGTKVEPA